MKLTKLILIFILGINLYSCKDKKEVVKTPVAEQAKTEPDKLEILDFHTAHRCKACISIEASTRETIKKYFSDDVNAGKLVFKLINADDAENEKIVDDYGAYGTSLFLNLIKDGKETHTDLTNFAFKKEANKEVFISELKSKIETELKKI